MNKTIELINRRNIWSDNEQWVVAICISAYVNSVEQYIKIFSFLRYIKIFDIRDQDQSTVKDREVKQNTNVKFSAEKMFFSILVSFWMFFVQGHNVTWKQLK